MSARVVVSRRPTTIALLSPLTCEQAAIDPHLRTTLGIARPPTRAREMGKIAHITLMPNDVTDLETALGQLVNILPNKVGLDKKQSESKK